MRKILLFILNQVASTVLVVMWLVLFAVLIYRHFENKEIQKNTHEQQISQSMDRSIDLLRDNVPELHVNDSSDNKANKLTKNKELMFNLVNNIFYTPIGQIYALYNTSTQKYGIYLNKSPIVEINNPEIIYAFSLVNGHVVIIFNDLYSNTKYYSYSILDITNSSHKLFHEIGNYKKIIDASVNNYNNCVQIKFEDSRSYSDLGDYELYQYCGNDVITKVMSVKSDEFYRSKFSNLTARDIFITAISDNCIESNNDNMIKSKSCGYSNEKYCYMFQYAKKTNDQYYDLMNSFCSNN